MKGIKITAMLLIICQAGIAQTKTAEQMTAKRMANLETTLSLSDAQKANIESIVLASSNKVIALKENQDVAREEIVKLRKEERTQIKAELSQVQQVQLKEANKVKKAKRQDKTRCKKSSQE